jgi:predicted transglutaminase-like protease
VLPDFLTPRKQFATAEIESVVKQSKAGKTPYDIDSKASISTIRRWLRETSTQDWKHPASVPYIITTVPTEPPVGAPERRLFTITGE